MWERVLLVAIGGAIGSVLRYALDGAVNDWFGPTVLGTFAINVSGALLLGVFLGVTEERFMAPALARTMIAIGLLGGYTTFSTLAYESIDLMESGSLWTGLLNGAGSIAMGLAAVYAGLVLGRSV